MVFGFHRFLKVAEGKNSRCQLSNEELRFSFWTMLEEMVLRHTDSSSKTLQDKMCSAAEGQQIAAMVIHTLQSLRNGSLLLCFGQG